MHVVGHCKLFSYVISVEVCGITLLLLQQKCNNKGRCSCNQHVSGNSCEISPGIIILIYYDFHVHLQVTLEYCGLQ